MKPRWKSVWITPAASGAVAPRLDRPGARLLRAGRQVGLQAEGGEADAGQQVEARLVLADRRQQLEGLRRRRARPARPRSSRRGRSPRPGATSARSSPTSGLVGQLVGVAVEDVEERLGGHQVQLAQRCRGRARRAKTVRPASSTSLGLAHGVDDRLPAPCPAGPPSPAAGSAFSIVCRSARISSVLIVSMSSAGDDLARRRA